MTETEWLACTEPKPMLAFLHGPLVRDVREMFGRLIPFESYPEQKGSARQLQLLTVACCRRYEYLLDAAHGQKLIEFGEQSGGGEFSPVGLPPDSLVRALELAECSADAPVEADALLAARNAADLFHFPAGDYTACYGEELGPFDTELVAAGKAAYAVYHACADQIGVHSVGGAMWELAYAADYLNSNGTGKTEHGGSPAERAAQADLIRDVFGNPFRPITFSPNWRTSTTTALAAQMYESRDFSAMPILADALQDAGCDSEAVLSHCRSSGPHVRGCWAVDLVLDRK